MHCRLGVPLCYIVKMYLHSASISTFEKGRSSAREVGEYSTTVPKWEHLMIRTSAHLMIRTTIHEPDRRLCDKDRCRCVVMRQLWCLVIWSIWRIWGYVLSVKPL